MDAYPPLMTAPGADQRFFGVTIGIVTNNKDPDGLGRVKVTPALDGRSGRDRLGQGGDTDGRRRPRRLFPAGGQRRGARGFRARRPGHPIRAGRACGTARTSRRSRTATARTTCARSRSRSGSLIRLTDTDGDAKIEIIDSSAKNTIVISSKDNSITITADGDVTIQSSNGKLKLTGNSVEITSASTVKIEASQSMDREVFWRS